MTMRTFIWAIAIVAALGFSIGSARKSVASNSDTNDSIFKAYDFPSHPNLTHLCQGHVTGSTGEITWDAFASTASPTALVDYYRRKLGTTGFTKQSNGGTWRLPANAPHPDRVLDIMAVGTDGPYRSCEKAPASESKSIIMLSRMH